MELQSGLSLFRNGAARGTGELRKLVGLGEVGALKRPTRDLQTHSRKLFRLQVFSWSWPATCGGKQLSEGEKGYSRWDEGSGSSTTQNHSIEPISPIFMPEAPGTGHTSRTTSVVV